MDSKPSAVGPTSVVPTVVDELEPTRPRVGAVGTRDRRVLVNLRVDGWRRTRREVVVDPVALPDHAGPDHTGAVVARNAVVQALARLPLAQRRVVVLRHLLDLTEVEVARELEISVGTVKSHHARAIARLRKIFAEGDL